jgi:hypothetical protein
MTLMTGGRYEHVWSNGNDGKGLVMDTWSLTEASHVHPPAPPAPPKPPAPPAPPPSPPAPTPAGYKWTCFAGQNVNGKALGLTDEQKQAVRETPPFLASFSCETRTDRSPRQALDTHKKY